MSTPREWPYKVENYRDQALEHLARAERLIEHVLDTQISPDEGEEAQELGLVGYRIHDAILNLQACKGKYEPN